MFANCKSASFKLTRDSYRVLSSTEFQPFVKLEDILDRRLTNVVRQNNIEILDLPEVLEPEYFERVTSSIENIKTEIKEELSEHFEDMAPTVNENGLHNIDLIFPDNIQIKSEPESEDLENIEFQTSSDIKSEHSTNFGEEDDCSSFVNDPRNLGESVETPLMVEENEDSSSLDLHLSPDSDDTFCENETLSKSCQNVPTSLETTSFSLQVCLKEGNSSHNSSSSPDMFESSPHDVTDRSTSTKTPSSRTSSSDDNRERHEEWNTEQLSRVSQSLRLRAKQARRLILEVVRKRQMADETLEAFKKRLRRM